MFPKQSKIKYYFLLFAYYLLVVLPHEQVGKFLASLFLPHSRARYNGLMLSILCIILLAAAFWAFRKVSKKDRVLISIYTVLSAVCIAICVNVLFVLNVEAIHFIQYGIFALICFQINKSYWKTMFWSVIAGSADELYQYVYLAPSKSNYYDFNDVIINAVGAGVGLVLLRVLNPHNNHFTRQGFLKSVELKFLLALIVFLMIGFSSGFISYGPNSDAAFCFMKVENIQFWHIVPPDIKFHVVKPIEGVIGAFFMILCYGFLERGSNGIADDAKKMMVFKG